MNTANPRVLPGALAVVGGVLAVVGSFLPWVTANFPKVGTVSHSGLDGGGHGAVSLAAGVVLIVLGLVFMSESTRRPKEIAIATGIAALVALGVAVYDYPSITDRITATGPGYQDLVNVGSGIYVVGAGGVLALFAAERMYRYWSSLSAPSSV
jgi:hypothetical protein